MDASRQSARRRALRACLQADPLLTDEGLALRLGVSVQTVRLDRRALGIPQVRGRLRAVAERALGRLDDAWSGAVLDLEPGRSATAVMEGVGDAGDAASDPGLFAGAESLALAASGLDLAVVEMVNVKFSRPAEAEGRLLARAEVVRRHEPGQRCVVLVQIRRDNRTLLRAKFRVAPGQPGPGLAGAAGGSRPGA